MLMLATVKENYVARAKSTPQLQPSRSLATTFLLFATKEGYKQENFEEPTDKKDGWRVTKKEQVQRAMYGKKPVRSSTIFFPLFLPRVNSTLAHTKTGISMIVYWEKK